MSTTSTILTSYALRNLIEIPDDDERARVREEIDEAMDIALWVETHIFCPVTGQILDSRTAQKATMIPLDEVGNPVIGKDGEIISDYICVAPGVTSTDSRMLKAVARVSEVTGRVVKLELSDASKLWERMKK